MGLISILLCKVRHTSVLFRWVLELVRSLFYHAVWCFWPHRAQRSLNYSRVTRSPAVVPFGTSAAVFCDPRLVPWDDLASPWPPLLRRELFPSQLPALRAAFCSSQHRFYLCSSHCYIQAAMHSAVLHRLLACCRLPTLCTAPSTTAASLCTPSMLILFSPSLSPVLSLYLFWLNRR